MRVLVCGGRDYNDMPRLYSVLDKLLDKYGDELIIITGAQRKMSRGEYVGADYLAEEWAKLREVPYMGFPAKWTKLKKSAGYERNKRMRDSSNPDACVAFQGGNGTKMMCDLMIEIGISPWCIDWQRETQ